MQSLSSNNYTDVTVYLRDEQTVTLPTAKGMALMDYLTSDLQTKHVKLTDLSGTVLVVAISDIRRVIPNIDVTLMEGAF